MEKSNEASNLEASIPETTAPPLSKKWLIPTLIGAVLLSLGLAGYFAYQTFQLKKEQPNLGQRTPTPAAKVPSPTTNPTSDWETYKNSAYGITFNYPNDYTTEREMTRNDGSFLYEIKSPPDPNYNPEMRAAAGLAENELNIAFIFTKNSSSIKVDDFLTKFKKKTLSDGFSKVTKTESIDINNQKIYLLTIERPQSPIKKTALLLSNSTQVEVTMEPVGSYREKEFLNILSTFRFSEQVNTTTPPVTNVKKISYSVPTGWITTTDSSNSFQISYDATKLKTCYPNQKGISLCAQYGSYFSASILPYDGSSRHQFIYNNGLGTPRKDELWSDYREQEYNLDGKSCLFLNGITISQYPAVWGMCAIDDTRAVLFTSYDRAENAYEAILKTMTSSPQ